MSIELLKPQLENPSQHFAWAQNPLTSKLAKWIAFRENDRDFLRGIHPGGWRADRPYKHDPLSNKISNAFADFLYGEDPAVKTKDLDDSQLMANMIEANDLSTEVHQGVRIFSSEGEVWWRLYTDPEQGDYPLVEWHSRTTVYPYWRGRIATAVAFVYEVERDADFVWRYVQYHEKERAVNSIYKASALTGQMIKNGREESPERDVMLLQKLGEEQELTSHPYTRGLEEEWDHGLPMLAGRLVNNVPRSRKIGKSDYDGIEDLLFDLNEAHSVDGENYKLAGKKRAVMPRKYQNQAGDADIAEEIFWVDEGIDEMEQETGPFKILEYNYDADSSIKRKADIERIALTRVGLVSQFTSMDSSDGWAQSGSSRKAALIPTTLAAHGKAREWDELLPKVVALMQQVDNLEEGKGGFGRAWKDPVGVPTIIRSTVMPEDPGDMATRHQTLITAELESIETAVDEMHPDWSPERKVLEVKRIFANRAGFGLDEDGKPIRNDDQPVTDEGGADVPLA